MNKFIIVFLLKMFFFTTSVFSISLMCNGSCTECRTFYPLIKEASMELKNDYIITEDILSNRYNSDIIPLLENRKVLLLEYDRLQGELEALNRLTEIKIKKLNREKENTK